MKKKERPKYVWVDDDNHLLKGYFKLQEIADNATITIFKKLKACIKKLFR
jgi:hypothetical protein